MAWADWIRGGAEIAPSLYAADFRRLGEQIDMLLAEHQLLTGPRRDPATLPAGQHVITARHTDRQSTILVRSHEPVLDPNWSVDQIDLEDLVLAYMGQARGRPFGISGQAETQMLENKR